LSLTTTPSTAGPFPPVKSDNQPSPGPPLTPIGRPMAIPLNGSNAPPPLPPFPKKPSPLPTKPPGVVITGPPGLYPVPVHTVEVSVITGGGVSPGDQFGLPCEV